MTPQTETRSQPNRAAQTEAQPGPHARTLSDVVTGETTWHAELIRNIGATIALNHLQPAQREKASALVAFVYHESDFQHDGHLWCQRSWKQFGNAMGDTHKSTIRTAVMGSLDNGLLIRVPHPRHQQKHLYRVPFENLKSEFARLVRTSQADPHLFEMPDANSPDERPDLKSLFRPVGETDRSNRSPPAPTAHAQLRDPDEWDGQLELLFSDVLRLEHVQSQHTKQLVDHEARIANLESAAATRPVAAADRSPDRSGFPHGGMVNGGNGLNGSFRTGGRMVDGARAPAERPVAQPVGPPDRSGGNFLMEPGHLLDPHVINDWFFEYALKRKKCNESDRHRVFALAHSAIRRFKNPGKGKGDPIEDPVCVFTHSVGHKLWKNANGTDDDWAKTQILALDREESGLAREPQEPTE